MCDLAGARDEARDDYREASPARTNRIPFLDGLR
jgi:hypothetical protein